MKMVLRQKRQIKNYKHYHRESLQLVMGHLQMRNPDEGLTGEMVQGQEDWEEEEEDGEDEDEGGEGLQAEICHERGAGARELERKN